jgi:hypothetical protein
MAKTDNIARLIVEGAGMREATHFVSWRVVFLAAAAVGALLALMPRSSKASRRAASSSISSIWAVILQATACQSCS